jgi:hypothetical protein
LVSDIEEHKLRALETRLLRRTLGATRDEVTGGWRKLHNKELPDLYPLTSIIKMIKSRRRMRWEWGRSETCIGYWWESQRERGH